MNTQSICFLVFVSCVATVLAKTPYRPCASDLGVATNVTILGCNQPPCILKKGTNITIFVEFTTHVDVPKVTEQVKGIIGGMPVPFPTTHPDACTTHGLTCPLKKGQKYTYTAVTPVREIYPDLRLVVQWAIGDDSEKLVFCLDIPAKIE